MIVIQQKMIYRQDLQANPNVLYIFGDNLERTGFGGQAKEMRGEPNAFGIATKRRPSHGSPADYFHDEEEDAWIKIYKEFEELKIQLIIFKADGGKKFKYRAIVIPSDGIGTGLAKLPEYAPKLLHYINTKLEEFKKL